METVVSHSESHGILGVHTSYLQVLITMSPWSDTKPLISGTLLILGLC